MTKRQLKKLLPVIEAFAEGRRVQVQLADGRWIVCHEPKWWDPRLKFRVKGNKAEIRRK